MPKPKGGKRIRRGKKQGEQSKRQLEFKEAEQDYAIVDKVLGGCRLEVTLTDQSTHLAIIPGKFRKRVWINKSDVILVGIRKFGDDKVDVMHKYVPEEVRKLIQYEEIPAKWGNMEDDDDGEQEKGNVAFGQDEDSEENEFQRGVLPQPKRGYDNVSDSDDDSEVEITKENAQDMLKDL